MTGQRAVVVGGGIAGLVAAFHLSRNGFRVTVLEQSTTLGGAVSSHHVAGIDLDAGAESFAVTRPAVAQLLGELGLADQIVDPAPLGAWVRHEAGTAPLPRMALLGIPAHPLAADVRRVLGWPGALRAATDRMLPPRFTDPTLGGLVRKRMGTRVLHRLVEPVVGGVHAADPSILETAALAPGLAEALGTNGSLAAAVQAIRSSPAASGSLVAGIRGGMHRLTAELSAAITRGSGQIRCGVSVIDLERTESQPLWQVRTADGGLPADAVVLAVGAADARTLLGPLLGHELIPHLAGQSTPVALVTLVVDEPRLDPAPRGTGLLVAPRAQPAHHRTANGQQALVQAKALTHASAKWPWLAQSLPVGRHVLRLSYGRGGPDHPPPPADADLPDIALADAAALLGVQLAAASVVDTAVVRWPSSLPQARQGHTHMVKAVRRSLATWPLAVVGAAFAGTGLASVVGDARDQVTELTGRVGTRSPAPAPVGGTNSPMGKDEVHEQ